MERAADTADWVEYYEAQAGREPREFFLDALERVGPAEGRSAVELGSGDGTETRWLLDHGWSVTAVDASPEGVALLRSRTGDRDDLTVVEAQARGRAAAPDRPRLLRLHAALLPT